MTALDLPEEVLGAPVKAGGGRGGASLWGGFTGGQRDDDDAERGAVGLSACVAGGADSLQLLRSEADGRRTLARLSLAPGSEGGVVAVASLPPGALPPGNLSLHAVAPHIALLVGEGGAAAAALWPAAPEGTLRLVPIARAPAAGLDGAAHIDPLADARGRGAASPPPDGAAGGAAGSRHLVLAGGARLLYGAKAELMRARRRRRAGDGPPAPRADRRGGFERCAAGRRRRRRVAARGSRDARVG